MNLGVRTTFDIGDGRMVTIETGKLAKQADGAAVVTMGNTMLLATVCCKKEAVEGTDFMPLHTRDASHSNHSCEKRPSSSHENPRPIIHVRNLPPVSAETWKSPLSLPPSREAPRKRLKRL